MPNDLSISDLGGLTTAALNIGKSGAVPVTSPAPVTSAATTASVRHTGPLPSPAPNPTLELNAALGIVVIEFRNAAGTVTNTIPSQHQLQAYQQWQESGVGSPPNIGGAATTAADTPIPLAAGDDSRSKLLDAGA